MAVAAAAAAVPHGGERTAPLVAGQTRSQKAMEADVEPSDDAPADWVAAVASLHLHSRRACDADAVAAAGAAAAGRQPWPPDADGGDADDAACTGDSPPEPELDDGPDCWPSLAALGDWLLVGRWAALRCRLPIPCRACSRNTGGSCAGCSCPSARSASGTWSTEMASRRCADACAP